MGQLQILHKYLCYFNANWWLNLSIYAVLSRISYCHDLRVFCVIFFLPQNVGWLKVLTNIMSGHIWLSLQCLSNPILSYIHILVPALIINKTEEHCQFVRRMSGGPRGMSRGCQGRGLGMWDDVGV